MSEKNRIHSGHTKSVTQIITPLYEEHLKSGGFRRGKDLLEQMQAVASASSSEEAGKIITQMLSQKRPPKYLYIVYYLLKYFEADIKGDSLFPGTFKDQAKEWVDAVSAEVEQYNTASNAERYNNAPRLKKLTDLIFELAIDNGFAAKENSKKKKSRIHSSLVDDSEWTRITLCRDLFSESKSKFDDDALFTLALILDTDEQFVCECLTRMQLSVHQKNATEKTRLLREQSLNLWNIQEFLVYVLCNCKNLPSDNIYNSYRMLYDLYYSDKCCADHSQVFPACPTHAIESHAGNVINYINNISKEPELLRQKILPLLCAHKSIVKNYKSNVTDFKKLSASPVCHLMAEYLIGKYHDKLAARSSVDVSVVCKEVEKYAGEYGSDNAEWQTFLTDCVFDTMSQAGFRAQNKSTKRGNQHAYVYSNLWKKDRDTWSKKSLCQALFAADKMDIKEFFTLAAALSMDIDFVCKYVVDTFCVPDKHKDSLNPHNIFHPSDVSELIVYLLCTERAVPCGITRYELFHLLQRKADTVSLPNKPIKTAENIWQLIDAQSGINEANLTEHESFFRLLSDIKCSSAEKRSKLKAHSFTRKKVKNTTKKSEPVHLHKAEHQFMENLNKSSTFLSKEQYFSSVDKPKSNGSYIIKCIEALCEHREVSDIPDNVMLRNVMACNFPSRSDISNISSGKFRVTRKHFLTAAFLSYTCQYESPSDDIRKKVDSIIQDLSDMLKEAGFDGIYLMDPYDCFLIYMSLLKQPFYEYLILWAKTKEKK